MSHPTNPSVTTTAAHRMLGITEMLEAILLETDPRTVLLSQRVNKIFQSTIKGSPGLQRRLCFRPAPAGDPSAISQFQDPLPNPLLFEIMEPRDDEQVEFWFVRYEENDDTYADDTDSDGFDDIEYFRLSILQYHTDRTVSAPPGSWQDMLVAEDREILECRVRYPSPRVTSAWFSRATDCGNGFTAGMLVDWLVDVMADIR